MGTVSFLLPESLPDAAARCLDLACLAGGYDRAAVPTRRKVENGQLVLTKEANESGYLSIPWPIPGVGVPVCLSATLRERPDPYHLLIELARGKLNQVRSQTAEWEAIGLAVEPEDQEELAAATKQFGAAVIDPTDPSVPAAMQEALARAVGLSDRISRSFAEQLLHTRLTESGRLDTRLGCRLAAVPPPEAQGEFADAFTAVRVVPDWSAIEPTESGYDWAALDAVIDWSLAAGLAVSVGPLIDLGSGAVPAWLRQWDGDLPSLAAFTCDFVETCLRRYQGRVRSWQLFAGFNHADALGLGEDDRIRLAARLLEAARQTDPAAEVVIGVTQPWGDYLASEDHTYSPLVFADTLLRAGFQIGGLELDLVWGEGGRASRPRDPLEVYRILELFSVLGVPLEATIGTAATSGGDAAGSCPPDWVATSVALAVALPQVRAVYWDRWSGTSADAAATSGTAGLPTDLPPVFGVLQGIRRQFIA